jgi:uncharacterized protein YciI
MSTFAVIYSYADGSDADRDEHRPAHRAYLRELHEQGRLVVSGPYVGGEPAGALLVFEGESADEIAALLDEDPFHKVGVVADRVIRPWEVVIGALG